MRYHIPWALFGCISDLEVIVPFDSDDVEVTNFSTWGGSKSRLADQGP
jgi:hypothetical protein